LARSKKAHRGGFGMPFSGDYALTQGFGQTTFTGEPPFGPYPHYHNGLDYAVPCQTPILAAADGTVTHASACDGVAWDTAWGNLVSIDHGGGVVSFYAHLSGFSVGVGAQVKRGTQVGLSGTTGNSTGCHLHLGVMVNGAFKDPTPYLDGSAAVNAPGAAPAPTSGIATAAMVVYWARSAHIPEDQLATAVAIAYQESGLQIDIENSIGACGLWQILHSAHPSYDKQKLLHDPQYNANAMADISGKGTNWRPWSSFNYKGETFVGDGKGDYTKYLAQARAAVQDTPPGSVPAGRADSPASDSAGSAQNAALWQDTSPQLPVTRYQISRVDVTPQALATVPGARAMGLLWISGTFVPVLSASCTLTTILQPGSWRAELSLAYLAQDQQADLRDVLLARARHQIVLYLGYRPAGDPRQVPASSAAAVSGVSGLVAMFTGLLDQQSFDWERMELSVGGPDMTGIFSDPSATLSSLDPGQASQSASELVKSIVKKHNAKGTTGLVADVAATEQGAGELLGDDVVTTRTAQQTEWDVLSKLAQDIGYVLYAEGTTIHFKPIPAPGPPQDLYYRSKAGKSPIMNVKTDRKPHSMRDYQVQVNSYSTEHNKVFQVRTGSGDAPNTIIVSLPPDQKWNVRVNRAKAVLARYVSTEVVQHLTIGGALPLSPFSPVLLHSDSLWPELCAPNEFYPAVITYDYDAQQGLSMQVSCTSRPPGIEEQASGTSAGGLLGI
jgi:hypothetical protein